MPLPMAMIKFMARLGNTTGNKSNTRRRQAYIAASATLKVKHDYDIKLFSFYRLSKRRNSKFRNTLREMVTA